ncbi:MAG: class I SAM-dependent methyltransferase [Pseudomonadota bacterium]
MADDTDLKDYNTLQRQYYENRPLAHNHRMVLRRSPYVLNHVDHMIELGQLDPSHRILDIGCGMGKFTIPLQERGFAVEGFDLSPKLLEALRAENANTPTVVGDLHDIAPELQGQYDRVVGFFMLHHLHDLGLAFRQIAKLVKPGGRVSFIEPNPNCPLFWIQITAMPTMSWKAEKGIFNLTRGNLRRLMTQAGFEAPDISQYGILPPFLRNRPGAAQVEAGFDKVAPLRPIAAFRRISARLA